MGKIFLPFTTSYSIKIKGNKAYRSYVIVATICLFLLTSDIETMIIYVIIYLFSETDVFFSEWLVKVYSIITCDSLFR